MEKEEQGNETSSPSSDTTATLCGLPENVLLHILSFLPIQDAITTSCLSRAWRSLWASSPSLRFSQTLITSSAMEYDGWFFISFVHQALLRHQKFNLQSLHVEFNYNDQRFSPHIDTWIRVAVSSTHFRELDLDFSADRSEDENPSDTARYDLPLSFLQSSSIRVLKVSRCHLLISTQTRLRCLRSLFLYDVVGLTDEVISDLLRRCPELESLVLASCEGMKHLKISSPKLKDLIIKFYWTKNSSVEIDAPNLVSFFCLHYNAVEFHFKDVSSLADVFVRFEHAPRYLRRWRKIMESISHARILSTTNWWGEHMILNIQEHREEALYRFKYLELATGFTKFEFLGLAMLLHHSPYLETIVLQMVPTMEVPTVEYDERYSGQLFEDVFPGSLPRLKSGEPLGKYFPGSLPKLQTDSFLERFFPGCRRQVNIVDFFQKFSPLCLPLLKLFRINAFRGTENELELVKFFLKHGMALEQVVLEPYDKYGFTHDLSSDFLAEKLEQVEAFPRYSALTEILLL